MDNNDFELHYVEFYSRGQVTSETNHTLVLSRNPLAVDVPEGSYGFKFFDMVYDLSDDDPLPIRRNDSGMYYTGGTIKTIDDIKFEMLQSNMLERVVYENILDNMEKNNWEKMIKTPAGTYQPFRPNDVLLTE